MVRASQPGQPAGVTIEAVEGMSVRDHREAVTEAIAEFEVARHRVRLGLATAAQAPARQSDVGARPRCGGTIALTPTHPQRQMDLHEFFIVPAVRFATWPSDSACYGIGSSRAPAGPCGASWVDGEPAARIQAPAVPL